MKLGTINSKERLLRCHALPKALDSKALGFAQVGMWAGSRVSYVTPFGMVISLKRWLGGMAP